MRKGKETKVGIIGVIVTVIGIGIEILLFFLAFRIKNMNNVYINVGFAIAGVFILGGILTAIFAFTTTRAKLINWGKSLQFQSPITRKVSNSVDNAQQKTKTKPECTTTDWLEKVVNDDLASLKSGIGHRIYYLKKEPSYNGIGKKEPYFELNIRTLNTASFSLLVEDAGGQLAIEDEPPCASPIQFVEEHKPIEIKHAECQWIKIKQEIKTKEMADYIRSIGKQNNHIRMNLNNCHLVIRPQIPGRQTDSIIVLLGEYIESIDYIEP